MKKRLESWWQEVKQILPVTAACVLVLLLVWWLLSQVPS